MQGISGNQRTRRAVDDWFISVNTGRSSFLAADQWTDALNLCKPLPCKAYLGIRFTQDLIRPCFRISVQEHLFPGHALHEKRRAWTFILRHALHDKGLQSQRRRSTGQQPGTNSARGPADNPLINRSSTGRFVLPSVYIGFRLFVLPKKPPGRLSSMPWGARGSVVSWANRLAGVPARPAPPRPAERRPASNRPWYVQVLDSTNYRNKLTSDHWAAIVLAINCSLTARRVPWFGLHMIWFVLPKMPPGWLF